MKKDSKSTGNSMSEMMKIIFFSILAIACSVISFNLSMNFTEKKSCEELVWDDHATLENGGATEQEIVETDSSIQSGKGNSSEIVWNLEKVDFYLEEETLPEGHIEFEKAINKAYLHVKKITGADVYGTNVSVHQANRYTDDECTVIDSVNFEISFKETEDEYIVIVDAVTGKIQGYLCYRNKGVTDQECIDNKIIIDGYRECELGYGIENYENNPDAVAEFWGEEIVEAMPKYNEIAARFVREVLEEGEVKEFYGHCTSTASSEQGVRYYYDLQCVTEQGEIQITIDQMTGMVIDYLRV